jgi:hypothetical protein
MEHKMSYKKYWNEQLTLQLNWRKKQKNLPVEYGFQYGFKYPHVIPKNVWIKTVFDPFNDELLKYLQKEKIQHHTGSHNLLSSWVLCSNLYFGTIINDNQKELFRKYLESKLDIKIDKIKDIHLELVLPKSLSPKVLLGEAGGIRGTRQTTPDLAIEFISNGKNGLILVECKYTEQSFYDCPGKKVNKKPCQECDNINTIEKECIQNEWGRKYWEYISISENGKKILKFCPAYIGGYQIFRQQALAEGIKKIGDYENIWSCIAYDGRNTGLMKSMERIGVSSIKDEWEKLFVLNTKFFVWEHQEWVKYVNDNGDGKFNKDWVIYIKNRYNF